MSKLAWKPSPGVESVAMVVQEPPPAGHPFYGLGPTQFPMTRETRSAVARRLSLDFMDPLFKRDVADKIDRLGRLQPVVYVHAMIVGIFLLTFLFSLGFLAARREHAPRLFAFGVGVFVLLLVQMGLGELQWRTHLPWGLVLLHVFLAATVWIGTVALATLFFRPNVDFAHR